MIKIWNINLNSINFVKNIKIMVGSKVRHKITGEKMEVIKTYGSVVVCLLDVPFIAKIVNMNMLIEKQICSISNLEILK